MSNTYNNRELAVTCISKIAAGLLASGHYTKADNEADPCNFHQIDEGKNYKENGATRRYTAMAVEHAQIIYEQIVSDVDFLMEKD